MKLQTGQNEIDHEGSKWVEGGSGKSTGPRANWRAHTRSEALYTLPLREQARGTWDNPHEGCKERQD